MSGTWNPDVYLKFASYRARPAEDLMARLTLSAPGDIYDLGCGPGMHARRLKDRWPDRTVTGVDSSPEMLAQARKKFGEADIAWRQGDIATWAPPRPAALIFANASLHWLDGHERLFPHLMDKLVPGGVLAVQMPATAAAPYHVGIARLVRSPPWREKLAAANPHPDCLPTNDYYALLAPLARDIDLWETEYHHILEGKDPVVSWTSGTALVPFLSRLSETDKPRFLADYRAEMAKAYPPEADGKVIFTMRRLFILAQSSWCKSKPPAPGGAGGFGIVLA